MYQTDPHPDLITVGSSIASNEHNSRLVFREVSCLTNLNESDASEWLMDVVAAGLHAP